MSPILPSASGLPRFWLHPDQYKELQRLERENHPALEQVRYVFEHDEPLPDVCVFQSYAPLGGVEIDDVLYRDMLPEPSEETILLNQEWNELVHEAGCPELAFRPFPIGRFFRPEDCPQYWLVKWMIETDQAGLKIGM